MRFNPNEKYIRIEQKRNGVFVFLLCKGKEQIPFAERTSDIVDAKARAQKFANMIGDCRIELVLQSGMVQTV